MPRIKGMDGALVKVRNACENVSMALVIVERLVQITRVRVQQARDRTGLYPLLDPALAELDEIHGEVQAAKREIASVMLLVS